jgi:hypothetical protein
VLANQLTSASVLSSSSAGAARLRFHLPRTGQAAWQARRLFPAILELWLPLWALHPLLRQPQLQDRGEGCVETAGRRRGGRQRSAGARNDFARRPITELTVTVRAAALLHQWYRRCRPTN